MTTRASGRAVWSRPSRALPQSWNRVLSRPLEVLPFWSRRTSLAGFRDSARVMPMPTAKESPTTRTVLVGWGACVPADVGAGVGEAGVSGSECLETAGGDAAGASAAMSAGEGAWGFGATAAAAGSGRSAGRAGVRAFSGMVKSRAVSGSTMREKVAPSGSDATGAVSGGDAGSGWRPAAWGAADSRPPGRPGETAGAWPACSR
jgi:hypothetical protein